MLRRKLGHKEKSLQTFPFHRGQTHLDFLLLALVGANRRSCFLSFRLSHCCKSIRRPAKSDNCEFLQVLPCTLAVMGRSTCPIASLISCIACKSAQRHLDVADLLEMSHSAT